MPRNTRGKAINISVRASWRKQSARFANRFGWRPTILCTIRLLPEFWKSGRLQECAAEFAKAMDSIPENSPARQRIALQLEEVSLELGADLGRKAQYKDGLAIASDAARRFPDSARVYQMLGFFQTKQRMNVAAVTSYRRALSLDSSSPRSVWVWEWRSRLPVCTPMRLPHWNPASGSFLAKHYICRDWAWCCWIPARANVPRLNSKLP